eukprot:g5597.t1
MVAEACAWTLMGNHDFGVLYEPTNFNPAAESSAYWTRAQFDAEQDEALRAKRYDFLGRLRVRVVETLPETDIPVLAVHASPRRPINEYIFPDDATDAPDKIEAIFERVERIALVGHTHVPGVFTDEPDFYPPAEIGDSGVYKFMDDEKVIINVGSVGQPRDQDPRASYAVLHNDRVEFHRVETMPSMPTSRTRRAPLGALTAPILALLLAAATPFALAQPGAADDAPDPQAPAQVTPETQPETQPETPPAAQPEAQPEPAPEPTLFVREWEGLPETLAVLAPYNEHTTELLSIEFSRFGAGIERLSLMDAYETVKRETHVTLQRARVDRANYYKAVPFALERVTINGEGVSLGSSASTWRQSADDPGRFEAEILDADGQTVARITRRFVIEPASYELRIEQKLENLTAEPMTVVWTQTGPVDLPTPKSLYGGDKRRARFGYLLNPEKQGTSTQVTADSRLTQRNKLIGKRDKTTGRYEVVRPLWPDEWTLNGGYRLVWAAMTDRYFAVVAHPLLDDPGNAPAEDKLFREARTLKRYLLNPESEQNDPDHPPIIVLSLTSDERVAPPGGVSDASIGVYAGPLNEPEIDADPLAVALGIDNIVIYNFGSICAFCTFGWLTHALLFVLRTLHAITFDWALSIILLVIVVRSILHPITRWSQIRMQRFGVQMQAMAPKQKLLKEKYSDDPKRLQQETAKLWREQGISPAGMLGCLPMFLQSPVWIALYATLYFVYDLRHEPAFYGVFQQISGGEWGFLADLASPDQAIPLPSAIHFSFWIWGSVTAINVLPIIMAFVFYAHQKYLTPPTTATLTPEQQQQQKMMKVMMIFMFPLFMYAAPSGLALYFVTNSTIAIFENRWIRAHMNKHGMLDPEKIQAERANKKGGGFLDRLKDVAEAQQAARDQGKNGMSAPGAIAAIASSPGAAPRAILRLSGDDTPRALSALGITDPARRAAAPVRVRLSDTQSLPALLLRSLAPHSYTGEHAAEILFPGNPRLAERLLAIVLGVEGVRLAEPGEFSARAYLSGRLSLAQAEGVGALISARTDEQLRAASDLLEGRTGQTYRAWSDELATLLALVEGGIDFTDQEDVTPIAPDQLSERVSALLHAIADRLGATGASERRNTLPLGVLVGEPSAGKSTLFNALLGRERAVTHESPGTTRDVLTETLRLDDAIPGAGSVLLADLPGLDAGAGDRGSQAQALDAIRRADLLIHCDPTGRFPPIEHAPEGAQVLRVRTKADLPASAQTGLGVCALDGYHLGALRRLLADAPLSAGGASALSVVPRHAHALARARDALTIALGAAPRGQLELTAAPLRDALDALGELTGEVSPDEIIGRVFATFCVGK